MDPGVAAVNSKSRRIGCSPGLPDFSWNKIPKRENIPNYDEEYQMSIKYHKRPKNGPSVHKIYQHLPLQDPPKFTRLWSFGLKTNHLATLMQSKAQSNAVSVVLQKEVV
jgi:hypothetical protein